MISFSAMNDFALLPISRSTEDMEDLYTDDFFWLHQRGVDMIFSLLFLHLLRKLYLKSYYSLQQSAWKSGSLMFLLLHGIIFFGLVLCCTHLSDITLKIAANVVFTLTGKYGSFGYWLFTDQTLNTDTLVRLMYLHYIIPFILVFLAACHLLDMHYGYRDNKNSNYLKITFFWFGEVLKNEIISFILLLACFWYLSEYLHHENSPVSFELFMWGDLGMVTDIRFLGVAPHWYFRAYMSWLIFCPHHYIGIFGLLYFFLVVFFQPELFVKLANRSSNSLALVKNTSFHHQTGFAILVLSLVYAGSYLPCGKFFTELEGNIASTFSFGFIFIRMTLDFPNLWYNSLYSRFFFKLKVIWIFFQY